MTDDAVTRWVESLEQGDEEAASRLWQYCFPKLLRYAARRLPDHLRRTMDEEDVALSAFKSFCLGSERGAFPELRGRDELWKLLLCITARKAQARLRHETREKRGGGKVSGESIFITDAAEGIPAGIGNVAGAAPTPDMMAQFSDGCEQLLERLGDDTLRAIALLRVEGYSVDEIAQRVGCAKRSVERRLNLIRKTWLDATDTENEEYL
ncbi:MAG: ECF-type sigma factor [Pirellulaceae bacterium]|nr:hypothetical protein [Planctomycetales bacterium]